MSDDQDPPPPVACAAPKFAARRLLPLVAIAILAVVVIAMGWHRQLSLEALLRHRAAIDEFIVNHYATAVAAYIGLYAVVVALSVPGALVLTLSGGFLFGALLGGLAAAVGATVGAVGIFLIARSTFGEHLVRSAGPLVAKVAEGFRADAFSYLLFLRLVPVFPFWLVNLVPALSGVGLGTFTLATVIGILPATFAFTFVGAGLDSVIVAQEASYNHCLTTGRSDCRLHFELMTALTPELFAALVALGVVALVPVVVKWLRARSRAAGASR